MPGTLTLPVSADEFDSLLENFTPPLSPTAKIALAVSGGPDSMALAFCVKRWGQRDMIAFIVDHALRTDSAAEAAQVKKSLEKMGVTAEILHWQHSDVTTRLHERAREARYDLLTSACRRHGASDLLIAHHRDDQAETILMRLAKGSGVEGLAGMSPQVMRGEVRLLRPFLSLPKDRLIATCKAASLSFVVDPSNNQEKFARGRLRKILPLLADEGMSVENLIGLGARAAEAGEALDHYTQTFLRGAAHGDKGGSVRIARAQLCEAPRAIGLRALTACLRYVHEGDHPPEHAALSSLLDALGRESLRSARTLYGCIVSAGQDWVTVMREPSASLETLPLRAGETVLWDKRWLVTAQKHGNMPPLTIGALGTQTHALIDRLAPALRAQIPQGRVRASLPALWHGQDILAIPSFDEKFVFHMAYRKRAFP